MELGAGFLIGFREALEAALIVGVLISLLYKTKRETMVKWVWGGVLFALIASILTWQAFEIFVGEFSKKNEELFEGVLYLFAALLVTTVVLQVIGHTSREIIENQAEEAIETRESFGIGLLAFISVWREGVETVIFIGTGTESSEAITGLFIGILLASIIGYALFTSMKNLDIRFMFNISTSLLIGFAAYLIMKAIHEFGEIGFMGIPESFPLQILGATIYLVIAHFVSEKYGISLAKSLTGTFKGIGNLLASKSE
ncbi:MAG: FTR1 family protein [archaeon]|nr:FTR1 family protein [archaeon]